MEKQEQEIELIDYLNVIWKRRWLILGGTLLSAVSALLFGLSVPKMYEVSRTLRIGKLPSTKSLIEDRETVVARMKDQRVLNILGEKLHLGLTTKEIVDLVSIDDKVNPHVRYTVRAHDAQRATSIADGLAEYIIKVHRPIFERELQIAKEYEAEFTANIHRVETQNRKLERKLEKAMEGPNFDPVAVEVIQANIGEREQYLAQLRNKLKRVRLARSRFNNTSVITADLLEQLINPRVKLNVALGTMLGLMIFTFLAFFLEYLENVRIRSRRE